MSDEWSFLEAGRIGSRSCSLIVQIAPVQANRLYSTKKQSHSGPAAVSAEP